MSGIYIHIPFCKKACHYCNFHFSTSPLLIPDMISGLLEEASLRKSYLNQPIETIYLGGGTPSLLNGSQLLTLLTGLQTILPWSEDAEITLEANPDDVHIENLAAWKQADINRLSIGIQSFHEMDLHWMNRAHTASQAISAIPLAQQAGFSNISIDLIYGGPTLSNEAWEQNIQKAIDLGVPHLSCYALTVEPDTALNAMIRTKKKQPVDPDRQANHFALLCDQLATAGFEQYEISNFAKPGFRSKHNSSYWQGSHYLGLGPSAHSFDGTSRQWNVSNNTLYLKSIASGSLPFEAETLSPEQQFNEYIMTSLRTIEGCSLEKIERTWGIDVKTSLLQGSAKYIALEHLSLRGDALQITPSGKFLADGIASALFQ